MDARLIRLANLNKTGVWSNAVRKAEQFCRQRCPIECDQLVYKNHHVTEYGMARPKPSLKVYFEHNMAYDVIISHVTAVSFLELVGTAGGIIGMWLGLSCLDLWNYARSGWAAYQARVKTKRNATLNI